MKFYRMFSESAKELSNLRSILVTGMLIAVSYAIESFTIELGFAKINFAFLALASSCAVICISPYFFFGQVLVTTNLRLIPISLIGI